MFKKHLNLQKTGNELVHAGSHARPLAVDIGMPSQVGSPEWWYPSGGGYRNALTSG